MDLKKGLILLWCGIATFTISGCETAKKGANLFTQGAYRLADLPNSSSSRLQVVMNYGAIKATPNSKYIETLENKTGMLAGANNSLDFMKKKMKGDLGMVKPTPKDYLAYPANLVDQKRPYTVVERYLESNQPIALQYTAPTGYNYECKVTGSFTPEANRDYRLFATVQGNKCAMFLEKFVKNPDGSITLQRINSSK